MQCAQHACRGRGGVSKARVEFVIVAHMAGDTKSFCVDSLMLEALDLPFD